MIPSQRRDLAWEDCRSRSPLSNPSKRCKNHRKGKGRGKASSRSTMEEREKAKNQEKRCWPQRGRGAPFKGLTDLPVMGIRDPSQNFWWEAGSSGVTQPTVRKLQYERLKTQA